VASLSGKDILIIDDADDARLLARRILEVDGAAVTDASSIDAGVAAARIQVPHLIVVDLDLPGKTGFDFLDFRSTDSLFRGIPTIVLSAKRDRTSVQKALSLGADDYVLKPFRATLVLQKIRKALRLSSFYSKKIPPGPLADAIFSISAEVVAINEVGCVVESLVKFGPEADVAIKSEYFRGLGAEDVRMRVVKEGGRFLEDGRYASEVSFIGIDREAAATLRARIGGKK
jgi:CheY-like chemotaxis protein